MNYAPLVVTGVGASQPIPTDTRDLANFAFNITPAPGNSSAVAQMQYTLDDVYAPGYNAATGNWMNCGPATTAGQNAVVQFVSSTQLLATAFRMNVTASSSTVSVQGWQNVKS